LVFQRRIERALKPRMSAAWIQVSSRFTARKITSRIFIVRSWAVGALAIRGPSSGPLIPPCHPARGSGHLVLPETGQIVLLTIPERDRLEVVAGRSHNPAP